MSHSYKTKLSANESICFVNRAKLVAERKFQYMEDWRVIEVNFPHISPKLPPNTLRIPYKHPKTPYNTP